MGKKCRLNILAIVSLMSLLGLITGCMEKDVYDPNYGKEPLPDPNEYFGFEMRNNVTLSVNYDLPGLVALLEVYDKNPMETVNGTPIKKEGIEALFKIYTDENGKYEGKMEIPASVNSIYLYTSSWGVPRCVKLDIKNNMASFDMSAKLSANQEKSTTRAYPFFPDAGQKVPYTINKTANLYSLCRWGDRGDLNYYVDYDQQKEYTDINPGYVTSVNKVGSENIGSFVSRLMTFFLANGGDNQRLVKESDVTNITTTAEEGTTLDVVFLNKDAAYHNTFGYYYYKTGETANPETLKKYILFPHVYISPELPWFQPILKCGDKVRLKYFDEQGKESDKFPKGYTVGWFVYADGYIFDSTKRKEHVDEIDVTKPLLTSNPASGKPQSFITVKDEKSGTVIIGLEDGGNKSYCDLIFHIEANPGSSIDNPDRPSTDPGEGGGGEKPDAVENRSGTLAFEDIWPSGGDYDMNDVIVEYTRSVFFNTRNMVTKIIDKFNPVHDGAAFKNAFAYQIDSGQYGTVSLDGGDSFEERETSSIILFPNAKTAVTAGKTYTVTRTFGANNTFSKDDLKDYNPYIIVNYVVGQRQRTEVHLPKHNATSFADAALIGSKDDAYYIDRKGNYPFAIDIPKLNFIPVTETKRIDSEYPDFSKWAESKGTSYTDWYDNYKK